MSQVPPYRLPSAPAQNSQDHFSASCPGCGAGYRIGLSACEYCRRPVRLSAESIDKEAIRSHFLRAYSGHGHVLTVLHQGEAIIPKAWA